MNKKTIFCLGIICFVMLSLASCGKGTYKDGFYSGRSSDDDTGAYADVDITINGGKISECQFITVQKDGSVKDENYGKVNGEISNVDFYNKAQLAVRAMDQYARELVEKQNLNKIDAVSGATIAYNQFLEAADYALTGAK
jgi:major membrane immunogen (membrane-anchored lipoprotein)